MKEKQDFKRVLGRWDTLALGFGAMIGFGWVVLAGDWITQAGTLGAVLAIVVGGVIMIFVGLTYAELSSSMPKAGGEHHYIFRAFGARPSFFGSWAIIGGYVTIIAFEGIALPRSLANIWPEINNVKLYDVWGSPVYLPWILVAVFSASIIAYFNIVGVRQASSLQVFVVSFLVVIGLMLVAGSLFNGSLARMEPLFANGANGFFTVMVVVPFLFVGFDVIPQSAEEARIPPKNVGKMVIFSLVLAILWYVMIILTTSSALSHNEITAAVKNNDLVTADAVEALYHSNVAGKILIAGGIAGILTTWNALLMGASRLLYSLGESRMLPRWFGVMHPRHKTPVNAIFFIMVFSMLAPFLGADMLGWLVDSGAPNIVVAYLLVSVTFVRLRRREPNMPRPLKIGGDTRFGVFVGGAAAVLCVILLLTYLPWMPSSITPQAWLLCAVWWAAGAIFLFRMPSVVEIEGKNPQGDKLTEKTMSALKQ